MKDEIYFVYKDNNYSQGKPIPLDTINLDKLRETIGEDAPTIYDIKIQNDTLHRLIEINVNTNLPDRTFEIVDIPKSIPPKAGRFVKLALYGKRLFEAKNVPDDVKLGIVCTESLERS